MKWIIGVTFISLMQLIIGYTYNNIMVVGLSSMLVGACIMGIVCLIAIEKEDKERLKDYNELLSKDKTE